MHRLRCDLALFAAKLSARQMVSLSKRQAKQRCGRKRRRWRCHKRALADPDGGSGSEQLGCVLERLASPFPFSRARSPPPISSSPLALRPPPPLHSQPPPLLETNPSPNSIPTHRRIKQAICGRDAEAVETRAGVGDQVLRGGGRRGGRGRRGRARALPPGPLRVLAPAGLLPAPLLRDQQPGHDHGRQGPGGGRRGDGRGPDAALLLQPRRAARRHARLLQRVPARGGRVRDRPQGVRGRRHAARARRPARRRQAARRRRPPGAQGVAGGGDLPGAVPAPAPGEAPGVLLRGRGASPGVRVHAARQPGEPPLQADLGDAAVGHADQGGHRRREGARLPPRRAAARDLPRLQGLQHPAGLGVHGEAVGLRAGEDGARGRGDARDDARDGHARVRGAGVRADGPPHHEERRVQLRRRAAGAPHGPPRHGVRPRPHRARRPDGQAGGVDAVLPRQQQAAAVRHGPEAGGPLLRQGRARGGAPRRAVHQRAAEGQAAHGRRRRGARAARGAQGHGGQRRALDGRAVGREERHIRQVPRRDQGRQRGCDRRRAEEDRVRQAALIG